MNQQTTEALEKLVEVNEESKGYRIVIDYALGLAFLGDSESRKEAEEYVEKLYEEKYNILLTLKT